MAYAEIGMRKIVERTGRFFAAVILFGLCALIATRPAARAEQAEARPSLRFGEDGTFTILLLADLQDTQFTSSYLIRSLQGVIADYPADLIVLLGDQFEGASPVMRLGNRYENAKLALARMLRPIVDSGIPFTFVFGNHDYDAPVSIARQMGLYRAYESCIMAGQGDGAPGNNVFSLPIFSSSGDSIAMNLYFFDSGADLPDGGYGAVSAGQVEWYVEQSEALRAANANQAIPSVAFMHVIVPEVYDLFARVSAGEPGAVRGVGVGAEHYYRLESDHIFAGEVREAPCPSTENNGLFDAFIRQNDVFLSVSGHDHINSFIAAHKGVDLLSAPGSTFTSYHDRAARGARLLRFTEHTVKDYETVHVRYSDYDAADGLGAAAYYLTTTTRIPNAVKVGVILLVLLTLTVLLAVSVFRRERSGPLPDMPEEADAPPEDPYL